MRAETSKNIGFDSRSPSEMINEDLGFDDNIFEEEKIDKIKAEDE